MSTQDVKPATLSVPEGPERSFPVRPLLIGFAAALLVGVLVLLGLRGSAEPQIASTAPNTLVLMPAAFLAGIFSFLSPCTLPILPAYFAFSFQMRRERVVLMTVAFFLGLATTMVILGAGATALSQVLFRNMRELTLVGGLVIVAFGVMSLLGKGFTGAKLLERPTASLAGSFLYGATFSLGWTACIGPIVGALYTLLATQGIAVLQGVVLSFIYALGIGTPLIVMSTFFNRLGSGSRFWRIVRGRSVEVNVGFTRLHLHTTSIASGLLLIIMGILLATEQLTMLNRWLQGTPMAQWSLGLEDWLYQLFVRR